ncbi:SDR family NAD(P)-dependent oxidoreductase [Psychrobacter sp. N25K4-3-2]|uniref:SDR family NAD(P)-dependent oxidoreductase n=1 Tax=Psychrobacter sp. N25K4-3-2 TaxID=2785026 RepID=UPI00188BA47C|nr:SDR family NAD(P)-dependent oxidoreductase [Psychrobacter sp. N25K4-3-2]MBF4489825.1 SDR family NAD(P)-dependent oxidoreductase [Psychrobacter sp. N25K4-3-2]
MKTKVKELTIWITGASSGIGEALAIDFAKRGARIILSGRDEAKLAAVKKICKHSKKHIIVPFDISDAEQAKEAYESAIAQTGKIDWLINNAGVSQRSLIMETSEDVERQIMEIDYFAQTRLTRLVLPDMIAQGGGKVVMISSVAGLLGTQYRGAYGAAKAALHMWANSLRAELHDQGIEVATIFPGFIQTNVSINALTGDGSAQGTMDEATSKGLSATEFAKQVVKALGNNKEYIIVGGKQEKLATRVNRVSPPKLYKLIRESQVK